VQINKPISRFSALLANASKQMALTHTRIAEKEQATFGHQFRHTLRILQELLRDRQGIIRRLHDPLVRLRVDRRDVELNMRGISDTHPLKRAAR
jgi:hypothetical protein